MTYSKAVLSLALCLILAVGCSDDDTTNGTADVGVDSAIADVGGGGDTGGAADQKVAADRGKEFSFTVRFKDHITSAFISGIKVCVKDMSSIPCVTSQGTGVTSGAQLTLPTGKDLVLVMTKTGYIKHTLFIGKDIAEDSYQINLLPTSMKTKMETNSKVTIDSTKGMLLVVAVDYLSGGYGNAKLALTPKAGDGPMTSDKEGYPDPSKQTTGSLGLSWAWYLNVPVADYTLQVKDNDGNICDVLVGWMGKSSKEGKIKPVADAVNEILYRCKEQKT